MLKEDKLNFIYNAQSCCMKMEADHFKTSRFLKLGRLYFVCVKSLKEVKSIMWGS